MCTSAASLPAQPAYQRCGGLADTEKERGSGEMLTAVFQMFPSPGGMTGSVRKLS